MLRESRNRGLVRREGKLVERRRFSVEEEEEQDLVGREGKLGEVEVLSGGKGRRGR